MISKEKIDEILNKTDIVDLVGEYISLEKVGNNFRGLCPFHSDHTPSFYVSPTKKIATCMTCKQGGNAISFIQKIKNISYVEAIVTLAKRANIEIEDENYEKINSKERQEKEKIQKNSKYYDIMQYALKFYNFCLHNTELGKKALDYLHNRKLSDETINMFKIGLAPNQYDSLYKTMNELEYLPLDLMEVGLVKKNSRNYYDIFVNRIIFPIIDENNNIIAFSGRIFNSTDISKYINSPETILFSKSKVLYNLNNAIFDIRRKKRVIICEGFMDVIAYYNADVREVVSTMGTALTKDHVLTLKKYTNDIVLSFDGDDAGLNATIKAIELIESLNLNVKILMFPNNLDPDEYRLKYSDSQLVEFSKTEMLDALEFRYIYYKKGKNFKNLSDIESFKNSFFKYLNTSNIGKELYFKKMSIELNLSYDSILNDYNNYYNINTSKKFVEDYSKNKNSENNNNSTNKASKKKNSIIAHGALKADKILLYLMINRKEKMWKIQEKYEEIDKMANENNIVPWFNYIYEYSGLSIDNFYSKRDKLHNYLTSYYQKNSSKSNNSVAFIESLPEELKSSYLDLDIIYNTTYEKDESELDLKISQSVLCIKKFILECKICTLKKEKGNEQEIINTKKQIVDIEQQIKDKKVV